MYAWPWCLCVWQFEILESLQFFSEVMFQNLLFSAFQCHSVKFLKKFYVAFILSKLEYASEVWNPYLQTDIDIIERVQGLFTHRLPGFKDLYILWATPWPVKMAKIVW
jgi:hypothetical protein